MRIHLSARTRAFTVLGNEVLRDRRLSFTARGILAYLLSLPDGAREDVRTLADRNPGLGRRGVANALDELVELGYYIRRTVKDAGTGQVRTETYLFDAPQTADVPQTADAPLPAPTGTGAAGTGVADGGKAGAFPSGELRGPELRGSEPGRRTLPPRARGGERRFAPGVGGCRGAWGRSSVPTGPCGAEVGAERR
ncbi:helix-turn-helix domain-containing protein [Streptomyces sp. NPDC090053]|uniref:helix-turn-helix domain-containing protein n=1 Tax=Streptomyces sp. NPDC090053 TaxID=3365932 RepID=UPI0038200C2A